MYSFVTNVASIVTIIRGVFACLAYFCVNNKNKDIMKSSSDASYLLVDRTYRECRDSVYRYILRKVECEEDSRDLTHDAFLRLLEYRRMLNEETVRHFLFTIARNLATDWLRRHCRHQEISAYLMEGLSASVQDAESEVIAGNLLQVELRKVECLPRKCRTIYRMSRFGEMTADEIAESLNLSKRTVEGHLLAGRRQVREFLRKCI